MPDLEALVARGLRVVRDGRVVLDGVDFAARAGRVLGIIGPNGAGKSSLLKAAVGILPYEGELTIAGAPARDLDPPERARRVAYVPQQSELRSALHVKDVVAQGRYAHTIGALRPSPADLNHVKRALVMAQAEDLAERPFTALSQGEKQRALIARALATGARVLLLDEPTAALDVGHALRLFTLLRSLAREGYCVLVVLHPLEQALEWTDDALLLHRGRRLAFGATEGVIREGPIESTYGVRLIPGGAVGFRLQDDPEGLS